MLKPVLSYTELKSAISSEIQKGALDIRAAFLRQVVVTNWNVGRILNQTLDLSSGTNSSFNKQMIRRLSKDFKRTESFFYVVAKFNRLYPTLPDDGPLNWTHYSTLVRVDDDKKRLAFEQEVRRGNLPARRLRVLISQDIKDEEALTLSQDNRARVFNGEAKLPVVRGRLYHYRVHKPDDSMPLGGKFLVDLGFNIERDVDARQTTQILPGHIVRVVKKDEEYSVSKSLYKPDRLYTYKATILKVVDGDTLKVCIDVGFHTWVTETIRLRGIDCPEVSCTAGLAARQYVRDQLAGVKFVIIKTYKQEKYGRFLGDVFRPRIGCKNSKSVCGDPAAVPQALEKSKKAADDAAVPDGGTNTDDPAEVLKTGIFLNQELLDRKFAEPYEC